MSLDADVIVVGAGACGLMAGYELSKAGKKVLILEARDRIGGRVYPLSVERYGYPAQGGGEFVHGEAPHTHALIKSAGLSYIPMNGTRWSSRNGEIESSKSSTENLHGNQDVSYMKEKLKELKEDISIQEFLDKYLGDERFNELRQIVIGMVEGYDAADPKKISTFTLRSDWLSSIEKPWIQGRIKEGYGALLNYLLEEIKSNNGKIILNSPVSDIEILKDYAIVKTAEKTTYQSLKVIVTVPLPIIERINFIPPILEKINASKKIGFGDVIKILIKFRERWWENILEGKFSKATFFLTKGTISYFWTQYPQLEPVITGWASGPVVAQISDYSEEKIIDMAVETLSNTFKIDKDYLKNLIVLAQVFNWRVDPYSLGAYSYSTIETEDAHKELSEPVHNTIYFAGEAL